MASGTADLQRDLGGAIMQSILGAVLTAGYSAAVAASIATAPNGDKVNDQVETALQKSFAGAEQIAESYPQYQHQIIQGAKQAFLDGADNAYIAGAAAIVLGALLVFFAFPRRDRERELLEEYAIEDGAVGPAAEPAVA
jgi:hypothetical protein